jgi:hypothetical protein
MSIKSEKPMIYECDKCKCEIFGGFNPTGFSFDHGGFKGELCRPCYEDYWAQFNKIEKQFVANFFAG